MGYTDSLHATMQKDPRQVFLNAGDCHKLLVAWLPKGLKLGWTFSPLVTVFEDTLVETLDDIVWLLVVTCLYDVGSGGRPDESVDKPDFGMARASIPAHGSSYRENQERSVALIEDRTRKLEICSDMDDQISEAEAEMCLREDEWRKEIMELKVKVRMDQEKHEKLL